MIKISQLKPNPNNPRLIKDDKFEKLVKSIKEFPEMLSKRKMICVTDTDGKMYPLGGNMRLRAIEELGYKEIPKEWIELADEWTKEQRNEFLIKDNIGYGFFDYDILSNEWDVDQLNDWGLEIKGLEEELEELPEEKTYIPTFKFEVECKTEQERNKLMAELMQRGITCTDNY